MPVGVSAYVPLATKTLTATATSVTFSSISQAYRDLVLVTNAKNTVANEPGFVRLNADSGNNYSMVFMGGNGSATSSSSFSSTFAFMSLTNYATFGTTQFTVNIANIMDYSTTDKHKTILFRSNASATGVDATAARWANTAAITNIVVTSNNSWAIGSTFTLYGIASA